MDTSSVTRVRNAISGNMGGPGLPDTNTCAKCTIALVTDSGRNALPDTAILPDMQYVLLQCVIQPGNPSSNRPFNQAFGLPFKGSVIERCRMSASDSASHINHSFNYPDK